MLKIIWSVGMVAWTILGLSRIKKGQLEKPKNVSEKFWLTYFKWFWPILAVIVFGCRLASAYFIWVNPWIGIALGLSMPLIVLLSIPISWIAIPLYALVFGWFNLRKR